MNTGNIANGMLAALPELLVARGFDLAMRETVERAFAEDLGLIDSRVVLEKFFRAASRKGGVQFPGNIESFASTLQFARNQNWLTEREKEFVSALYGLLSDAGAHPGASIVEPKFAKQAVLHTLWLVLTRLQIRISRPPHSLGGSAGRLRLAEQFLKGLRSGTHVGPAFDDIYDLDLMQLTRDRLRYSDVPLLMRVIRDDNASAELRNRCASLVLSPRSFRKPHDPNQARTISELDEYCRSYLHQLPWQVSRAIALALANRANHPDRLIEYLQWISEKPEIIEENLRESDIYYSSKDDAIAYYKSRLRNRDVPLGGCIWEIFYILHRGQGEDRRFIEGIMRGRSKEVVESVVKTFWDSTAKLLKR